MSGRVAGASDLIDIAAEVRMERDSAIALYDGREDADGREVWAWVPRSLIEDNGLGGSCGGVPRTPRGTFAMPEWLAREKGLI